METKRILIANRGEIAARLIRTYRLFPVSPSTPRIETVAVYTRSESNALHVHLADHSVQLQGEGPKAYLDAKALVSLAKDKGCWGIAPGHGFLSEDAGFARLCEESGLTFLGPTSHQLQLLGNKVSARELAQKTGVPILPGTKASASSDFPLTDILKFAEAQPLGSKIILKAANGGGGRGIRIIQLPSSAEPRELQQLVTDAYESCRREALSSFGEGTVYAERFLTNARHVEVQILGDGKGSVSHFWDRECSLQRRNQKMIEIAPAGSLTSELRQGILDAAVRLAGEVNLRSLATIEFLVDQAQGQGGFYFMEANPRIQVEHTITEQVTGVELVALQLLVGLGASLAELGIASSSPTPFPTKVSVQARVNAESFRGPSDEAHPEAGTISSLIWPLGRDVRVESAAHPPHPVLGKYAVNPLFDSLLAKVIVTAPNFASALEAARRALTETSIEGVRTNASFLLALLTHEQVKQDKHHIHTVQSDFPALLEKANGFEAEINTRSQHANSKDGAKAEGKEQGQNWEADGKVTVKTHLSGLVIKISVKEGEQVAAGQELAVIEAMKMEHIIRASSSGATVHKVLVEQGGVVNTSDVLLVLTPSISDTSAASGGEPAAAEMLEDPAVPRPELQELFQRRKAFTDEGRVSMVQKRHARGYRTVRENLSMLVDPDTLIEYGDLALASQRSYRSMDDLIAKTTGDGIVTGFAKIATHTVALVLGDYLVLAGTQGRLHHYKLDRILNAILAHPCPVVLYAEGGGGRPGDSDVPVATGLVTPSFALMGRVRAMGIPSVGVANGYVFAGNAALLGACDVVVATRGGMASLAGKNGRPGTTSIGMGGSAMIEAGGLGVFESDEIGPVDVHCATGGIDVLVNNEDEAVSMSRKLIGLFTTSRLPEREWRYRSNPLSLRTCIPPASERRRAFDMSKVISLIVDDDSFIEFSPHWGVGLITGFARIGGMSIAIIANDALSPLGGAIDLNCALKAVRMLRLLTRTRACHLVCLCDTPGFMVGPEFERTANTGSFRAFGDWFSAANEYELSGGKIVGLVLRRAFGLGAQAMLGGSTQSNSVCACWPTASLGPMSLEGAVKLGFKKQLEAIKGEEERTREEARLVEGLYKQGEGINAASMVEMDTVLDPGESREWLRKVLGVLGERKATYKVRAEQALNPHL